MNIIAAVDNNWAIGKDNSLLVRIPEDLKFFKEMTIGKVVVMGRKTLESFTSGPLKNRTNIVLTNDLNFNMDGVIVVHSLDELEHQLENYNTEDVFIIGGGSIYKQLLDKCDKAYITSIFKDFEADTFFPDLSLKSEWSLVKMSSVYSYNDIHYIFTEYERKK